MSKKAGAEVERAKEVAEKTVVSPEQANAMIKEFEVKVESAKYTLAITAGAFAYASEKLLPQSTLTGAILVLLLLLVLLGAAVTGVVILAIAMSGQFKDGKTLKLVAPIGEWAGWVHCSLLTIGLVSIGSTLGYRVLSERPPPEKASVVVLDVWDRGASAPSSAPLRACLLTDDPVRSSDCWNLSNRPVSWEAIWGRIRCNCEEPGAMQRTQRPDNY